MQSRSFKKVSRYFMGGLAFLLAGAAGLYALTAGTLPRVQDFTPAQIARIRSVTHDYIMDNPRIVLDAVGKYQQQATNQYLASDADTLETPFPGAVSGNPDGDVTIVEFSDYRCGFCRRMQGELHKVLASDSNVRIVHRMYPILDRGGEPLSNYAAQIALAAALQGRFAKVNEAIYAVDGRLTREKLVAAIREAGIDENRLARDLNSDVITAEIKRNAELGRALNLAGTPAFIIGDQLVPGAVEADTLLDLVHQARKSPARPL